MLSKKIKYILTILIFIIIILNTNVIFSVQNDNTDEPVISSMIKYKTIDYQFLKTYDFGEIHEKDAVIILDTAEELKNSRDIRLENNKYIRTKGYYEADDLGGASYLISNESGKYGTIELLNGLYANLVPDTYVDNDNVNWIVLSVKQFGARGDSSTPDQDAINSAFSYVNSYKEKDRAIIYLPEGEYKACNQIQANTSNINLVGDGDNSVIFTDNDYRKEIAYDEPFFASWEGKNNFFGNFKVEAREVDLKKYMRQMCLFYCENMYIYNVNYYVPEEAWSGLEFEDKQYTNLTIYSGDKQITVDSCTMYQMSGTYRGANIGIMDFWSRGTEDITIMNCELHDNARDEQVGIFSFSGRSESYVKNVDFVNNKVYTYTTPYKEIHGCRTMCFTVAYGNNNVQDINISNNHFISDTDSKFMTFGSVRDCRVQNNKFEIISSDGKKGYVFDSSCTRDEDVIIDNNEFYITYKNSPVEGKCLSAGHLTFSNNKVVIDCQMNKISDRLGIYENNDFTFLTPLGSCGSALKFNNNNVISYGGHNNFYSEIMFIANEGDENTEMEYVGNKITDYEYYNGARTSKPYDRLSSINGVTLNSIKFCNNIYNCPNYKYKTTDDYIYLSWYRSGSNVKDFICENNDLQGAKGIYGYEIDNTKNVTREFTANGDDAFVTSIDILKDRQKVTEITVPDKTVDLTTVIKVVDEYDEEGNVISEIESTNKDIDWLTNYESIASVDNGVVTRNNYGDVTAFATSKDGSGVYSKVLIHFVKSDVDDIQVTTEIQCENTQINSGEEVELIFKLRTDEEIKEYINVYKAKIEYDKNIFEDLTEEDFSVCNTWTSLKYNPESGEFVTVNFNDINELEDVIKVKLKVKDIIDDTTTNIKISNIETGNWKDKQDIVVYTIDGLEEKNILFDIQKQENNVDNETDKKEENNGDNEQDNKEENEGNNKTDEKEENNEDNITDKKEENNGNNVPDNKEESNKDNATDNEGQNNGNNIEDDTEGNDANIVLDNKEDSGNVVTDNKEESTHNSVTTNNQKIQTEQNSEKPGIIPNLGKNNNIILKIFLMIFMIILIISIIKIKKIKKIKYKTFTILLAITLSIAISSTSNVNAASRLGDIDSNRKVDIEDIIILEKHLIKLNTINDIKLADMNGDDILSISDLAILVHKLGENTQIGDNNNNNTDDDNNSTIIDERNTKTAAEAVKEMKIGWNLGNALDSCDYKKMYLGEEKAIEYYETVWGNPITTKEMIDEVKKAGFESVRLPVTYYDHIKPDGVIDEKWFERVKEVVGYILGNDMYCILDVHHDTGLYENGSWIVTDADKYEENAQKLSDLWTQIAEQFKDYNYKLVFEGFNEIVDSKKNYDWVTGYENTINVNKLNQVFVDTVRKTGGNNEDRFLVVTTFGGITDDQKLSTFTMPKDTVEDKIILALHDYSYAENAVDSLFERINKYCTDKNIPVILDEFGTMATLTSQDERAKMANYYVSKAKDIGVTCFWWDNGNSNEYMILNRKNLSWEYPEIKDALVNCFN